MPACRPEGLPKGLQFCNFEYNLWGKRAEYFDRQMDAGHPTCCNGDVKLMKVCTIRSPLSTHMDELSFHNNFLKFSGFFTNLLLLLIHLHSCFHSITMAEW